MDIFNNISDAVGGWVDSLGQTVYDFFWSIFYYIAYGLCKLVAIMNDMADIFAGLSKVEYNGERNYLLNIFFTHNSISNVYWAIALIGMMLCIGFTIVAVIRKTFDIGEKVRQSLGQILTSAFKGILMISLTTAAMIGVFSICSTVMEQMEYVFSYSDVLDVPETMTFTEKQYAKMAKILNTIGNYSMNPTYNSRYNINSCFNSIRKDLKELQDEKVFRMYYNTVDENGEADISWQSALQDIAKAVSLDKDVNLDQYNEALSNAMMNVMDFLRNNGSFKPKKSVKRIYKTGTERISIDKIIFLMGTTQAAKNSIYNENPTVTDDPLRAPYYLGDKSIYSLEQVKKDFDIGTSMNYLIIYIAGVKMFLDLTTIIFNCIACIFNVLVLYLISPLIFATTPLDDGGKVKQWSIAYIVQSLGVFANIFAMRLMMMLIPIIMDSKLVLFSDSTILNVFAKLVLMFGLFAATKKTTGIITGILSDQAGFQSVQAGDMSHVAGGALMAASTVGKTAGSFGLRVTRTVGTGAAALSRQINRPSQRRFGGGSSGGTGTEVSNGASDMGSSGGSGDLSSPSRAGGASSEASNDSSSSGGSSGSFGGVNIPSKEGGEAKSESSGNSKGMSNESYKRLFGVDKPSSKGGNKSSGGNSSRDGSGVNSPSKERSQASSESSGNSRGMSNESYKRLFGVDKPSSEGGDTSGSSGDVKGPSKEGGEAKSESSGNSKGISNESYKRLFGVDKPSSKGGSKSSGGNLSRERSGVNSPSKERSQAGSESSGNSDGSNPSKEGGGVSSEVSADSGESNPSKEGGGVSSEVSVDSGESNLSKESGGVSSEASVNSGESNLSEESGQNGGSSVEGNGSSKKKRSALSYKELFGIDPLSSNGGVNGSAKKEGASASEAAASKESLQNNVVEAPSKEPPPGL